MKAYTLITEGWRPGIGIFGAVMLASVLVFGTAAAAAPAPCHVRLTVELTPDVPDPTDEGFLGSLLSNQVNYLLSVRRERSDSLLVLDLTGPGPDYRCRNAIAVIRRDGRVLSVHVNKAPS
jgi:hypothetical protein